MRFLEGEAYHETAQEAIARNQADQADYFYHGLRSKEEAFGWYLVLMVMGIVLYHRLKAR